MQEMRYRIKAKNPKPEQTWDFLPYAIKKLGGQYHCLC